MNIQFNIRQIILAKIFPLVVDSIHYLHQTIQLLGTI